MKRLLLICLCSFAVVSLYSQSQRLVLLEEFTQASCGPCASINPTIENLLNQNPEKITSVFYHTSWPGYDPMNLQNPTEVASRVSYYGVTYVPWSVLDGNYYSGSASGWNINTVNTRYAVPSPFTMSLQHQLNAAEDSIFVTMVAQATMAVSGNMTAHNAVIEKNIHFNSPPGSNGEKDFRNVMKKMLPSKDGTSLPSSMAVGDYIIVQEGWKLANVYDKTQLAAVAFVQNKTTKEIHQSVNSSTSPVVLPYANDLQMMDVADFSPTNCSGTLAPRITIRNNGNNTVTSFSVKYRINDEPEMVYSWTGSISSLQKAVIDLPAYTFTPVAENILKVYATDPNAVPDEYMKNDTLTYTIDAAPVTSNQIFVYVKTDNTPQENTWDIRNSSGTIIATGGPYANATTLYKDTVDLPSYDCYTFTIYDAGGNGLCCVNGSGLYFLVDNQNTAIITGNSFGTEEFCEFSYTEPQGIPTLKSAGSLTVAPNPSSGNGRAILELNDPSEVSAMLLNPLGKIVKNYHPGLLFPGEQSFSLESEDLAPGMYLLRVMVGKQVMSAKVSITK
ncbi:MAG TPA: T9SS type A sorting domain-containing protein [Bacteroidales bacterium]|nr:T9SS type A sorting domain-containing protein [Bacteroidales bacterium]